MLDTYRNTQNIIYQTIVNSVKKNTLSHAYLIELNDSNYGLDFDMSSSRYGKLY